MPQDRTIDWSAVLADPRFVTLVQRKRRFLWGLMAISTGYYFLLPLGAGYFPELFRVRVWGVINVGLTFALSEFVVAWAIAWYYSRRAGGEFDRLAAELANHYTVQGSK